MVPFVCRHSDNAVFSFAFVKAVAEANAEGKLARQPLIAAFKQICIGMMSGLRFPGEPERQHPAMTSNYLDIPGVPKPQVHKNAALNPDDVVVAQGLCLDLEMHAQVSSLLQRLQRESANVGLEYFDSLILPYLRNAVHLLKSKDIDLATIEYQAMFVNILTHYVDRFVKIEPAKPTDWTKQKHGCRKCGDCQELDAFLSSPVEKVKHFRMGQDRRKQLERQLPYYYDRQPSDLMATTDRRGSPQTLIITKSHSRYDQEHRAWATRKFQARSKIVEIASETDLKTLLVDEFEAIAHLGRVTLVRLPDGRQGHPENFPHFRKVLEPLANPPGVAGNAASGVHHSMKRKVAPDASGDEPSTKRTKMPEIVDLCDSP